jgi:hypothetical protein
MSNSIGESSQNKNDWFVLIGDQKYGPYDYKTVIHMIQSNQLMDYNYVWASHLEAWTQIHQLDEFSKDRFQVLLQKESEFLGAFTKRSNPRAEINVPILGHNNIRFFDGSLVSVSEVGGLCLLNTPLIQVGDSLKLHIKSPQISFNVEGEIIRKNFSKQRLNSKSGLYYAVRFHDIQTAGLKQIRHWLQTSKNANQEVA